MRTCQAAILVVIFGGLVSCIPANAETFTLAQLVGGEDFTIGTAQFTGWALDTNDSSADPNKG